MPLLDGATRRLSHAESGSRGAFTIKAAGCGPQISRILAQPRGHFPAHQLRFQFAREKYSNGEASMNWEAFWLTVRLAAIVSTLLIAIGIPIAYWLTYSRWRWKFLVEAAVALPIVLPPTVLGFYVLMALGSRGPLGRWWESLTGHTLAFTFEGLIIGSLLYS